MVGFPRTQIGKVSVSRMIIGTNWFLGYTHSTSGQSRAVERIVTNRDAIANIIEAFLIEDVDTIMASTTISIPGSVKNSSSSKPPALRRINARLFMVLILVKLNASLMKK